MSINLKKLESYRPEIKLQEIGTTIGSIVRWHRKQKNMTLNEGADGICSISYLSKVENNLIEPSDQILDDLKKRFELEELLNYDLKRYEEHYSDIVDKLFGYKEIPTFYFKLYETKTDYKSKLVLFAYYIQRHNLIKAKKVYKDLEYEINKFNHDEINLFYLLTSLMLIEEGKYYIALRILNLSNVINVNSKLSMLIDYKKIYLNLMLGKFMQSFNLSEDLEKRLLKNHNLLRYNNLLKLKLFYTVDEYDYQYSLDKINEQQFLTRKEKELNKTFLNLLRNQKISKTLLEKNISDSNDWYLINLLYFDFLEDYQKIKEIMNKSSKFGSNPVNQHIEFFLDSKYNMDSDSFSRYIKNISTNFENNYNGYYFLSLLYENAANYYENKTFYKTANLIRKLSKELLSNLKRMT